MKRFEDFDENDLAKLRKEICLNSIYVADYENSFAIAPESVCAFFDGFVSFMQELAEENNEDISDSDIFEKYDTIDNLVSWYYCYDDFSWVKYDFDFYLESIENLFSEESIIPDVESCIESLKSALKAKVDCYDDYIYDGIGDDDCEDEYLMCRCFSTEKPNLTIRIYYGNHTRIIGDVEVICE